MPTLLFVVIALLWLGGTIIRIYQQARYFQIEEYMNGRYLIWLFRKPEFLLPRRSIAAAFIASIISVVMSEAPGSFVPMLILAAGSLIAVWPAREAPVKKRFNATSRARRLLGTAFTVSLAASLIAFWLASQIATLSDRLTGPALVMSGLLVFLMVPLLLVIANIMMIPVEEFMRRRFMSRAQAIMQAVQPRVIGVTGSYGKTTTKNYIRDFLNLRYRAYATPKSYNTLMGLSLAINNDLARDYSIEYFVAEMGMYKPGEIARLCAFTPPQIGVVIEVGPQHLERAGSIENIARAKYELIEGTAPDGLGIFNWDNPYTRAMYERGYPAHRIAVSTLADPANAPADGPRLIASEIEEDLNGLRFTLFDRQTQEQVSIETSLYGRHNVMNILLAAAVALHEGIPLRDIALRARMLQAAESRLVKQQTSNGITIINDAYSANPVGAANALKVLGMHQTGKRVLITPGMVELGGLQESENYELGKTAAQYASTIILVGSQQSAPIHAGALAAGFPKDQLHTVETLAEAVSWYQTNLGVGDTVLFLNDLPDTY